MEKTASDAGTVQALQKVYVPAGVYTVSAFFSTNGVDLSRSASVLFAEAVNISDNTYDSRKYGEKFQSTDAGEWERLSLTIEIGEGQYLRFCAGFDSNTYGTLWVDDIQVEQGYGVSGYNILENPEFLNGADGWTVTAASYTNPDTSLTGFTKCIRLNTALGGSCSITQSVPFNGVKGQVFSVGAWANAYSAPTTSSKVFLGSQYPSYKLKVSLYNGVRLAGSAEAEYNPNLNVMQFQSMRVAAAGNFNRVEVAFLYDGNCNRAYLTGVYCLPEEYGETYTYDNNGNLISAASVSGSSSGYGFASNNLTASASETGAQNFVGYTAEHLATAAVNTSRGMYKLHRDGNNNVDWVTLQPARRVTALEAGHTYFFVNVQTGMALYAKNTTAGDPVVSHSFNKSKATQRWTIEAGPGENEFRLKTTTDNNVTTYLGMASASTAYGIKCVNAAAAAAANISLFKLQPCADGTFAFLTKGSNYENALDGALLLDEVKENSEIKAFMFDSTRKAQQWFAFEYKSIGSASGDIYYQENFEYTANGNFQTKHIDITGHETNYAYNTTTGQLTSVTDPNNVTTSYSYNNMNRVTGVQSGALSVGYTYTHDLLTGVSVTGGPGYTFTYDSFGRLTGSKLGNITLADNMYNSAGLVTLSKYAGDSGFTGYTYDSLDRPTAKIYNSSQKHYYYGADGLLAQTTDEAADTRDLYVYDQAGRPVAVKTFSGTDISTNTLKSQLGYTYMPGDNRIASIYTKSALGVNTLSFTYGELSQNQPTDNVYQETWNNTVEKTNDYDELNRRNTYTLHTPSNAELITTYSFWVDPNNGKRQSPQVSQLTTPAGTYNYAYDNVGNITSETMGGKTTSYVYDTNNRLVRENNQRQGKTYVYAYTTSGDISSRKTYAYTTGTLGAEIIPSDTYEYSNGLLTQYKDNTITYSGVTVTGFGGYTVDWYKSGLLGNYSKTGSTNTYTYDMDGVRLSKTENGITTNFYYAGGMLVGQKTGNNALVFKFDHASDYYGFTYGGNNYWYIKNLQNDVVAIANDAGNIIVRYYYDAWGRLLSTKDANGNEITNQTHIAHINPIRYRSYYYDTGTGFYFLQSRYYNPEIGRFLSADKLLDERSFDGNNLFAYCSNNPVDRCDPSGEAWWHWAIGAAIVTACAVATVVTCGGFAAAIGAVAAVSSGVAAATTASTIAAGAFIGSATVYGMSALNAALSSSSVQDFNNQGNLGTVIGTAGGAVLCGTAAYSATRTPTTTVYRSVSDAEALDIKNTGQFNLAPGGMEVKQFGFSLSETRQFGNILGQNAIVSARVPNSMLNQLYTGIVDSSIFRAGTLTVYGDQLAAFNQAVCGTIKFLY